MGTSSSVATPRLPARTSGGYSTILPELEIPASFSRSEVEHWIERIDLVPLRAAVRKRWADVASRVGGGA